MDFRALPLFTTSLLTVSIMTTWEKYNLWYYPNLFSLFITLSVKPKISILSVCYDPNTFEIILFNF